MRRRSRTRRVLKWVGAVTCVLIVVAWGMSVFKIVVVARTSYNSHWAVMIHYGSLTARWHTGYFPPSPVTVEVIPVNSTVILRARLGLHLPVGHILPIGTGMSYKIVMPFWLVLGMVAVPTAFFWHRNRRPPKGHCQSCGYDLTGNVSGVCPECGELVGGREPT